MYRVLSDKFLVILRTLFLLPLQKSFSSNSSSTNWSYFGIKIQALWTSDADRCNFKGNFFCWVFSVTQGFGELIFTVSVVGEKERRATLSNHSSLWASGSFCTLELWRWRKPGSGYSPQPLKAGWALLKPPKQMVVDQSFKDPGVDILQPPLLTGISAQPVFMRITSFLCVLHQQ